MNRGIKIAAVCLLALLTACTIKYSFTGSNIDYTKVKSVSIKDFPNQAAMVYPPLAQILTEEMKDIFTRRTRLQILNNNGDLDVEGEITRFDLSQEAVTEDMYASMSRLTIAVRVRYTNKSAPHEDFEQTFTANRSFPATQMLQDVQDELSREIVKEIVDQVYNSTVANW